MTEHVTPEQQFVDKTVTRSGVKEINGSKCEWRLHALPEYADDDERLSLGVVDKVADVLINMGYKDATVTVVEGYEDEAIGNEHYRLSMTFGNGSENKKFIYAKGYSAEGDHGQVKGEVRSTVGLPTDSDEDHLEISEEAASIYIGEMESIYTDWKNEWEGGGFVDLYN